MTAEVTRREALAGGAAGLAALSLTGAGFAADRAGGRPQDSKPAGPAYVARDFSALLGTPGFSNTLLQNHFTLYQGYVKNTNTLAEALDENAKMGTLSSPAAAEMRRRFGWEFNGMRLHELYFENLGGKEPAPKDGKAAKQITAAFGNFEAWAKEFQGVGSMRGIGWVALMRDPTNGRLFNVWINEHDLGALAGCPILLIMDVFEHAFMTDYGIKRADYIAAFMKAINWTAVDARF
jgi:superoxide dismutase, Fe-Mn family